MKTKVSTLIVAALGLASAHGATLQISQAPFSLATVQNNAGTNTNGLTWGILVDTAGDGYNFSTTFAPGTLLENGLFGGSADDYLYLAPGATTNLGPSNGVVTSLEANFDDSPLVNGGDPYKIIWFEGSDAGGAIQNGFLGLSASDSTLPALNSDFGPAAAPGFIGDNGPANQPVVVVPEPSIALLGALGVFGLIRRRR